VQPWAHSLRADLFLAVTGEHPDERRREVEIAVRMFL
jgi:hypothetical protein